MSQKKYASFSTLQIFLDNLRTTFSSLYHKHTISDITDYKVDNALSSSSLNPVQNKVINGEFEAISDAMNVLENVVSGKADSSHNHDDKYDEIGSASGALTSAKTYTDTKTSGLASTTVVDTKISTHNTSTSSHNDIRSLISGLTTRLNTLADSDDTTLDQLSEIVAYIKNNKSLIDSITTSKVNVSDIINNLTTNVTNKPLSAAQGVAIKALIDALQEELDNHSHAISDVSGLQSALDGKADSSHGTHVTFDSTNKPKMNGTAAFGTSTKVARADHVHPTDTSRASQTALDALSEVVDEKADALHTHAIADVTNLQSSLDAKQDTITGGATTIISNNLTGDRVLTSNSNGKVSVSDVTSTELNYLSGTTSNIQTQLNNKLSLSGGIKLVSGDDLNNCTAVGVYIAENSTIAKNIANTPVTDAGFKVIVIDGYVSGRVTQFMTTNTANLYHRKFNGTSWSDWAHIYDTINMPTLAELGVTATAEELNKLDGITATTAELNYMDGVTSSVQSQIDTLEATILNKIDTHSNNTNIHITSTERTNWNDANSKKHSHDNKSVLDGITSKLVSNWNTAKTHSDSAHAPSNAEKNQNAFSNIAVSGQTTVAADSATDTITFAGSNVSITTDATNDKITFAVADGSTSAKGLLKLTNSTSSTSTTTAATPSSVKSAYDLANTAKTNAATAQARADSAYSLAESKVDSLSDLGITATATELNYVDGVTSNIQTQLNTLSSNMDGFTDWFSVGTSIPSGSDLNTYTTPGKYYVSSTSISGNISNSPVTNDNYSLFVFSRTSSSKVSLTQMIITLGSAMYIRNNSSNGEWRDWFKYAKSSEVSTQINNAMNTLREEILGGAW